MQVKQSTEILKEGLKQENLLARDFEFAFYKKVSSCSFQPLVSQSHCSIYYIHQAFPPYSLGSLYGPVAGNFNKQLKASPFLIFCRCWLQTKGQSAWFEHTPSSQTLKHWPTGLPPNKETRKPTTLWPPTQLPQELPTTPMPRISSLIQPYLSHKLVFFRIW